MNTKYLTLPIAIGILYEVKVKSSLYIMFLKKDIS